MRRRTSLVLLAGALLLAGCGSSREPRTVAGVRATVERFIADLTAANGGDACALMTASAKAQLRSISGIGSCEQTVATASGLDTGSASQRAQLAHYEATVPITLHGNVATVPSTGGERTERLLYENGRWLFDNS